MGETRLLEGLLERVRALEPVIRDHADQSDQQRRLADPIVEGLRDAGLYRMVTPAELGGIGAEPITLYRIIEEISAIDGSTGWCVFINGSCPVTGAFLAPDAAQAIYGDKHAIASGTVFPFGRAEQADGGYRVSGRWSYASGSWHSTWHFAFCNVYEPGADQPLPGPDGEPLVVVPHIPRTEVDLIETWDVVGLAGTGSHDVAIDTWVPGEHVWTVGDARRLDGPYSGPLYRLPLPVVFAWPVAAVSLGIARGALEAMMAAAQTKRHPQTGKVQAEQPLIQLQVAQATAKLEAARAWMHSCVHEMWRKAMGDETVTVKELVLGQLAATHAVQEAAAASEIVFRAGGASAIHTRSPLQRAFRDANAAAQHFATAPGQLLVTGAALLGRPLDNPLLLL